MPETSRPTVLLFDIDGTLILTGGAGRRAMEGAFAALHGNPKVFEGVSFAGMTDRAIARHGLTALSTALGASENEMDREIDRALDRYLELLHQELTAADGYRILPGVEALLTAISGRSNVAIGLGTGNIKRGAYAKLARGKLDRAFAFGGFGCDAEDRTELLRAGAARGATALSARVEDCRVIVIGDTPRDVAAAKGLGVPCIGVATGGYSVTKLRECGASHAFETLEHPDVHGALFG